MKQVMAYLRDESGQTSTEYVLLVAVVAMIIFRLKNTMRSGLEGITSTVFGTAGDLAGKIGGD